jgi:hypothetical protein
MAYATPEQLAAAMHMTATPQNTDALTSALEAAATEIDQVCDRIEPMPTPAPDLVVQVNVARGVEWMKAADAAFGGVGYGDVGILKTPPDGMQRHMLTLMPFKQQWGVA